MKTRRRCAPPFSCYPRKTAGGGVQTPPPPSRAKVNMVRSQKWPDLRSPISKIQDIRFVGTDDLIIFRKFHNFPWSIVAVAWWESYFVVGSLDLTWWPDLTWPWAEISTKVAEEMGGKVGENPAARSAAVFSLSSKNLRGAFKRLPQQGAG